MQITDLERAFNALRAKQPIYDRYWAYYDGNAPTIYSTKKLREIFGKSIDSVWRENWCAPVVNAAYERINLARFDVEGEKELTKSLNDLWVQTEMNLDSDTVHLASLVCGEGYVICGFAEDGSVEAYYNDPRDCWISYNKRSPKLKEFAAKWWVGDDKLRYMTLYYPDRFEHYRSRTEARNMSKGGPEAWDLLETETNPEGVIPVFQVRKDRRAIKSDLLDAIDIQNAINKLLADMMISSEFASSKQRYILSNAEGLTSFRSSDAVWIIPAGDKETEPTQIGEFAAAELQQFLDAIERFQRDLAVITRTPKHYIAGQNGDPSGEALIAMEAPLVKKCLDYIDRFTPEWAKIAAFMMRLAGTDVSPDAITPVFDPVETVQPRTRAEVSEIRTRAGVPLKTVLRREEGWSDSELQQLDKDKAEEDKSAADMFAAKAGAAGAFFDRGTGA